MQSTDTPPTVDLDKIRTTIVHAREDAEGWYDAARPLTGRQHFNFAGAGRMLNNTADAAEQLLTALAAERDRADRAEALLSEIVDSAECVFDFNGACQAHDFLSLAPGERCPHQDAKTIIARHPEATA